MTDFSELFPKCNQEDYFGQRLKNEIKYFIEDAIDHISFGNDGEFLASYPGCLRFGKVIHFDGSSGFTEEYSHTIPLYLCLNFIKEITLMFAFFENPKLENNFIHDLTNAYKNFQEIAEAKNKPVMIRKVKLLNMTIQSKQKRIKINQTEDVDCLAETVPLYK